MYFKYRKALFTNILKITRDPEISKDILQEVFIALWKIRYYAAAKQYQLFNLPKDYREENDLAKLLSKLKAMLLHQCAGDINNGIFSDSKNVRNVN